MISKKNVILPKLERILAIMGENLKLARLRRKLSAEQVSERAGISRATLHKIEKGASSVAIGSYINVLSVLRLEEDLQMIALDDEFGRKLQDAQLITKKRAPKGGV